MGHFFRFCFPKKKTTSVHKNKKQNDAFSGLPQYCLPGRILKPITKNALKQDYSLWAILLIMSSTWGHFIFFPFAPKQLHAALVSSDTTPAANHCYLSKLILQSRGKIKKPRGLLFLGHIDALVVDAGPLFLLTRCTPSRRKASLLTSPKTYKATFVLQNQDVPRETFRSCKTI